MIKSKIETIFCLKAIDCKVNINPQCSTTTMVFGQSFHHSHLLSLPILCILSSKPHSHVFIYHINPSLQWPASLCASFNLFTVPKNLFISIASSHNVPTYNNSFQILSFYNVHCWLLIFHLLLYRFISLYIQIIIVP